MIREHFAYRETITTVLADSAEYIAAAKEAMLSARGMLEEYIASDPFFKISYEPVDVTASAPLIVRRMADAAAEANVGPMASVAASIAWAGAEAMREAGASFGLIDNGGDIAFFSDRVLRVGIHAGCAPSSDKFAFVVPQSDSIRGICTSSATVGPSVSFGTADAVVCFSENPAKADAWATSLCNRITPDNFLAEMPAVSALNGVYAVIGDWIGRWGNLPEIVPAKVDRELITKG